MFIERKLRCDVFGFMKNVLCVFVSLFFLAAFSASFCFASDWPMFHGDEKRSGATQETLSAPFSLKWQVQVGTSVSSVAKSGGKIFVGSKDGKVYAFDAFSGGKLWEFQTSGAVDSSPAVADGKVYVASRDGNIYCVDANLGTLQWYQNSGGTNISSPLVSNGYVYYGAGYPSTVVYALTTSGQIAWQFATEQPVYSSPALLNGVLYVGSNDGNYYFLNAQNGAKLNAFSSQGTIYFAAPAVSDKLYVSGGDYGKLFFAVDSQTAQQVWQHTLGGNDNYVKVSSPAVANGVVYVSAGYPQQKLYAIDVSNGQLKWQVTFGNVGDWNYLSSPVVAGDKVLVGTTTGKLVVLDAATGNSLYEYQTGGAIISSPAVASGMIYVASTDGTLYGFASTDTTNPVASISAPTANAAFSKSLIISGTANDEHLQKYVLSYGTGENPQSYTDFLTSYNEVQNNTLGTWDASALSSGTYTIKLTAYDVANNQASATVVVQLDNTSPALTVDAPQDRLKTNQKNTTVSGSTEAGSTVTVNNVAVSVDAQNKFSTTVSLSEGENTITVEAKDSLNNAVTVTRKVTLDTAPPPLTVSSPVDGLLTNQSPVAVSGTTEAGAALTVNGNAVSVDAQGAFTTNMNLNLGENSFTITATDAVTNSQTKTIKVTYDPNAPSLEITYPPDNLITNKKDLTVTGKTEAGATLTINDANVSVDAEGKFSYALALNEGENNLAIISTDKAGNKITAARKVTLDTKIPELSVAAPADGLITNQPKITVTGKTEAGATLKVNDAVVVVNADGAFSYEMSLKEGDNIISAVASDAAGNSITVTRKVTLDTQPPTGSVSLVTDGKTKGNYVTGKEVALKLEAQDNLKVAQVAYALTSDLSALWKDFTQSPMQETLSLGECCGDKTIYVQYKDSAGNVSDADTKAEGSQPYTVTVTQVEGVKTVSLSVPGTNPELVDLGPIKVDMETVKAAGDLNFVLTKAQVENKEVGAADPLELRLEFYNTAGKKSGEETLGRVSVWLYLKYDNLYKGAPLQNESALAVYVYKNSGAWERLPGFQQVDTQAKTVKALAPLILNRNYTLQVVQEKSVPPDAVSVLNYPNPAHGDTTFSYGVSSGIPEQIFIDVYALSGKKVLTMNVPPPFTGKFTTQDVDILPNGVYVYRIQVSVSGKTLTKTGKLVLLK